MKKTIVFCLFVLAKTIACYSQANDDKLIIYAMPQISWSLGTLKNTSSIGIGGHTGFEVAVAEKARIGLAYGSTFYTGRKRKPTYANYDDTYPDYVFGHIAAGFKYFYYDGLFVQVQGGGLFSIEHEPSRGWGVYYAPVLGYEFGSGRYYDISLRIENNVLKGKNYTGLALGLNYEF